MRASARDTDAEEVGAFLHRESQAAPDQIFERKLAFLG